MDDKDEFDVDVQDDYVGQFPSEIAYIRQAVACQLPPHMVWLVELAPDDPLRQEYEAGKLRVWSMPGTVPGVRLIFESSR